jgi:hypothetical protein
MFRYKARTDPCIFQRGNSMPLSLAFKAEGSTIGFQRGKVHYWFSNGESTFKITFIYIAPSSNGGKGGFDHCIIHHSTFKLISQHLILRMS